MSDIEYIKRFIEQNEDAYLTLLGDVRSSCEKARFKLGKDVIHHLYDRRDASAGRSSFKEPKRILNSARRRGVGIENRELLKLPDIIGLTVVINFPDDFDDVIGESIRFLEAHDLQISEPYVFENYYGYYARHVNVVRRIKGLPYACEIQFKTMLHDAWGSKMHNLTYKPSGNVDPKATALFSAIGQSIESIERQSLILRDIIRSGFETEEAARTSTRSTLFANVLKYGEEHWTRIKSQEIQDLEAHLEDHLDHFRDCDLDDKQLVEFLENLETACSDEENLRFGWVLAGRLSSERIDRDLGLFLSTLTDSWLSKLENKVRENPEIIQKPESMNDTKDDYISEAELTAVCHMYYIAGELDGAIDTSNGILRSPVFSASLSSETLNLLRFNMATYIVEREYHEPTKHKASREALRTHVEEVLFNPEIIAQDGLKSAAIDSQGLFKIAFAEDIVEVREGIELCVTARGLATASEQDVTDAYADLHLRLGWRRFFHFEDSPAVRGISPADDDGPHGDA